MADPDDEVVRCVQFFPAAIPPRGKELHEIEEHEKNGDAGDHLDVVIERFAVFRTGVQTRNIPLAQPDHQQGGENAEFEQEYDVFHNRIQLAAGKEKQTFCHPAHVRREFSSIPRTKPFLHAV